MSSALRSNNRLRNPSRQSAEPEPNIAGQSILVTRYPMALDIPPTITEKTPLSGLYSNFLALLLEAVQGEIGPIVLPFYPAQGRPFSLQEWLGSEVAGNAVSCWNSSAKAQGGNARGQIFGLQVHTVSGVATSFGTLPSVLVPISQGIHLGGKEPVTFGMVSAFGHLPTDFFAGPAVIRGRATQLALNWSLIYRGAAGDAPGGLPTGSGTFNAALLMLYMVEGQ